jgi:hypothetical protein|tara:strand:- start:555 stop:788 length:234 start_codon:yes stop_codon:yes gene_type:complete
MSAKIYCNQHLWGEFGLRVGSGSQTVTLCLQEAGKTEIQELIMFAVVNNRLIFTSKNPGFAAGNWEPVREKEDTHEE